VPAVKKSFIDFFNSSKLLLPPTYSSASLLANLASASGEYSTSLYLLPKPAFELGLTLTSFLPHVRGFHHF
jgi:hypothetical protein